MSSLYIFATQSGNIPLSELDDNFAEVSQRVLENPAHARGVRSELRGDSRRKPTLDVI